jgi:hypothetical protein
MTKMILVLAACGLVLTGTAMADAYKLDDKGKCHDDHGKFAKQALCVTASAHVYKLDTKKKCRDEKGRFADAKFCHA